MSGTSDVIIVLLSTCVFRVSDDVEGDAYDILYCVCMSGLSHHPVQDACKAPSLGYGYGGAAACLIQFSQPDG